MSLLPSCDRPGGKLLLQRSLQGGQSSELPRCRHCLQVPSTHGRVRDRDRVHRRQRPHRSGHQYPGTSQVSPVLTCPPVFLHHRLLIKEELVVSFICCFISLFFITRTSSSRTTSESMNQTLSELNFLSSLRFGTRTDGFRTSPTNTPSCGTPCRPSRLLPSTPGPTPQPARRPWRRGRCCPRTAVSTSRRALRDSWSRGPRTARRAKRPTRCTRRRRPSTATRTEQLRQNSQVETNVGNISHLSRFMTCTAANHQGAIHTFCFHL